MTDFRLALGLRNRNQPVVRWAHIDRLRLLSEGEDIAPVTFDVDPVNFCNHRCQWCLDSYHGTAVLPIETIESFAEEISQFEVNGTRCAGIILKGGGEPTLHPEFARLVRLFAGGGCDIGLITNGSRLGLDDICEAVACSMSFVRISLDAASDMSHQKKHGSKDFNEIVSGIRSLVDGSVENGPTVGLTFIVEPDSKDEIFAFVDLAQYLSVDYVQFRLPYCEEVGYVPRFTARQWNDIYVFLQSLGGELGGVKIFLSGYIPKELAKKRLSQDDYPIEQQTGCCLAHRLTAMLNASSWVYGCCEHRNAPEYRFGHLEYPSCTLSDIWQSQQRSAALDKMQNAHCIDLCTQPVSQYNTAVMQMQECRRPWTSFV